MSRAILIILLALIAGGAYILFRPHQRMDELATAAKLRSKPEDSHWKQFDAQSGKFSVDFPSQPQHASDTINDNATQQLKKYEMFVAEGLDGGVFMINLITYPQEEVVKDKQQIFKNFLDDMLTSNPRNQLVSSSNIQYNNHDGMDFKLKNDEATINSKMFLDGNTLYVLSKVTKNNNKDAGDFDRFVSSFKLNNSNQSEAVNNSQKK